jgi:hypothetical protein
MLKFIFDLVHVAYKHNAPQIIPSINIHPLAIVTAAVDRIGLVHVGFALVIMLTLSSFRL